MIRLYENLLYAFPFSIFLVFKGHFLISLVTLVLCAIVSLSNNVRRVRFQIPSPFSGRPYEFTVGFRRFFPFIIGTYLLTFFSIYYHNFNLGLFGLLSIFLICLLFYSNPEPAFYVWIHAQSPKTFLLKKIKTALVYAFYLSIVVTGLLIYFYNTELAMIIITLVAGLFYITAGVLSVYINYPNRMTITQQLLLSFGILFPPVLLLIIPFFYAQAEDKLKSYLKC
jgi:hypothetical protein